MAKELDLEGQGRLVWVDLAKGVCIVLVVALHVHTKHYTHLEWSLSGPITSLWDGFHLTFAPMRIPLFFAMSGMLAACALQRPWGDILLPRLAAPYYLYAVWLCLHAAWYARLGSDVDGLLVQDGWRFAARFLVPTSSLWYVFALALYFPLAKLLLRWPVWWGLSAAFVVAAVAPSYLVPIDIVAIAVPTNFPFYLLGATLPGILRDASRQARPREAALAGLLYSGVVALYVFGLYELPGVVVAGGGVALWWGALLSVRAARSRRLARAGSHLGRHTLPIFLLHMPLIASLRWLAEGPGEWFWRQRLLESHVVAGLYPAVVTGLVVWLCLQGGRLLNLRPLQWLVRVPVRSSVGGRAR